MQRTLVAAIRELTRKQREEIRRAACAHGFEALFFDSPEDAMPALTDAEVVFGQSEFLARNAPRLRWLCSPFAGVDNFLAPGAFASAEAVLSNSSGAYGVTIAEHIVMVALEMLRRQLDYDAIVARRGWRRDLAVRSIHQSRVTLLGTGDIGREAARRLRAFRPERIVGVNRGGRDESGLFDRVREKFPGLEINLVPVKNDFFGGTVDVTGLLVGRDLVRRLRQETLGDEILIPGAMLMADEDVFLDDMTLEALSAALGVPAKRMQKDAGGELRDILGPLPETIQ